MTSPLKRELVLYLKEAAQSAVEQLGDQRIRRIACMDWTQIPLLLDGDIADRCDDDGFDLLQQEIHRLCCARAGMKAA